MFNKNISIRLINNNNELKINSNIKENELFQHIKDKEEFITAYDSLGMEAYRKSLSF